MKHKESDLYRNDDDEDSSEIDIEEAYFYNQLMEVAEGLKKVLAGNENTSTMDSPNKDFLDVLDGFLCKLHEEEQDVTKLKILQYVTNLRLNGDDSDCNFPTS